MTGVLREYTTKPSRCEVGFQTINFNSGNVASLAARYAAAAGTVFQTQFSWAAVEDYTTGTLALPTLFQTALNACVTYNLKPLIVAAYGPPWTNLMNVTVASDTAVGSYVIPTNESTASVDYPYCYVIKPNNSVITGQNANYYGSLIDSVGSNQLNLAAVTNVFLPAGTTLTVTRLRYPAVGTNSLTDTSVLAYIRYARFLAAQITAAGLTGWVKIWNELPWPNDSWHARFLAYDSVHGNYNSLATTTISKMQTILTATSTGPVVSGVPFINGGADKASALSMAFMHLCTTAPQLQVMHGDSIHPYAINPEGDSWYYPGSGPYGTCTATNLDTIWALSNFQDIKELGCAWSVIDNLPELKMSATECGTTYQGSDKASVNSRYLRRRVASLWGNNVSPVCIHDLENDPTDIYDIITQGAGACLFQLSQQLVALGGDGTTPIPTVSVAGGFPWDLMKVCIQGLNGTLTLLWQRTSDATNWNNMTRPAAITVTVTPLSGQVVSGALNLETGQAVAVAPTFQVTDDILAILTQPSNTPPPPVPPPPTPGSAPNGAETAAVAILRRGTIAAT